MSDMEVDENHYIPEEEEKPNKKKNKKKKRKRVDVKIQVLKENPDKISPLLGYFPSGYNPHNEQDDAPQVKLFRKTNRPNRLQLVVSPNEGCKVDFVGHTHSGEAAASQVCTYALAVLDKNTQTLKFVPIASNRILRLEPIIKGVDVKEDVKEDKPKEEENANPFESKAAMRRDKKKADLKKQKTDPSTQKNLKDIIQNVAINKEAHVGVVADALRNIPPYDANATTPETAYPLDCIINSVEWDYLLDILKLVHAGEDINTDAYPSFVCNRIQKLLEIEDNVERKKLACIFSYITYLIRFKDKKSPGYASSGKDHYIPDILFRRLMSMFTELDRNFLSIEKRNHLFSYILVLTLHADGFKTDFTDIAKDLKVTAVTLRDHYTNLGCKLSHEGKLLFAKLPVPLQFPKLKLGRRKK